MNKKELAELMVERGDYETKSESTAAIDRVFDCITDVLSAKKSKTTGPKNEEVKIAGFGNFKVKDRKAGKARNPQTGEEVKVPAKTVCKFTPLKALKEKVDPRLAKK